jgi:hypothetical protein
LRKTRKRSKQREVSGKSEDVEATLLVVLRIRILHFYNQKRELAEEKEREREREKE